MPPKTIVVAPKAIGPTAATPAAISAVTSTETSLRITQPPAKAKSPAVVDTVAGDAPLEVLPTVPIGWVEGAGDAIPSEGNLSHQSTLWAAGW